MSSRYSDASPTSTAVGNETSHLSLNERPTKRQKVAAACDECRVKKIRCNGVKPVCTPCERRYGASAQCEWGQRKTRSIGASKLEIMRLQSRIDELERSRGPGGGGGGGGGGEKRSNSKARRGARMSSPPSMANSPAEDVNQDPDTNAMMGLMEEAAGGAVGTTRTIGDSSAASFMKQIKSVLDQQLTPDFGQQPAQYNTATTSPATLAIASRQRRFKTPDYVLPSRHQADHLLEIYWQLVDTLYPFLDKADFMRNYQSIWTGKPSMDDEICFICLVNAIFSIACILDSSIRPSDRVSSAEVFYRRAKACLDLDFLQYRSVHTVQCLLVLAQYLQSTNDPQQCWLFAGLAIRIAQSLGLDLPTTSAATQQTAGGGVASGGGRPNDLYRKVWHGCVLMDRTLSMTFGRPAIITSQAAASVPRPLPHPDPREECSCHRVLWSPSSPTEDDENRDLHFFIESLKLYETMSEALLALYNPVTEPGNPDDGYVRFFGDAGAKAAGTVLEMDSKLSLWHGGLPMHLRHHEPQEAPDLAPARSAIHARQTKVLWLRYCHIRTLLFRPVLSRFCSMGDAVSTGDRNLAEESKDTLARKLALQCSVMCVENALRTVHLFQTVHERRDVERLDEVMPSWWYSIFYLYTAATVLVAARLNPTIESELGAEVILHASNTVTTVLKRYEGFGKHAKRCAAAISLLFDQIPRQQRGQSDYRVRPPPTQQQQPPPAHQQQQQQHEQHPQQQQPSQQVQHQQMISPSAERPTPGALLGHEFRANGSGNGQQDQSEQSRQWDDWSNQVLRDRNRHLSEAGSEQVWIYDQRTPAGAPGYLTEQHAPSVDILEASDLRFDLMGGDMSWLSSIPFELYSET